MQHKSVPPAVLFLVTRLFAVLSILAGLGLAGFGLREARIAAESGRWPATPGVVRDSLVESQTEKGAAEAHRTVVLYTYFVDGAGYLADRVSQSDAWSADRAAAEAIVEKYPPGAQVSVHYNPENPGEAFLEPGPGRTDPVFFAAGGALVASGVFDWAVLPLLLGRRRRGKAEAGGVESGPGE